MTETKAERAVRIARERVVRAARKLRLIWIDEGPTSDAFTRAAKDVASITDDLDYATRKLAVERRRGGKAKR